MRIRLRPYRRHTSSSRRPSQAAKARREHARAMILARVAHWASRMRVETKRVAIRDQRSRWGSASTLGNLNFNWRICHMPPDVFDYIIIHELAHLKEMNHSPAFWAAVATHCPGYKVHRRWLRANGGRYHRILV